MPRSTHAERKWMKQLKRHLQLSRREREAGIRDGRWIDGARLPK